MILIGENPFQGPLEGVGPENRDLATSEVQAPYKKTGTLIILCTCVLLQVYSVFCNLYSVICIQYSVLYVLSFM